MTSVVSTAAWAQNTAVDSGALEEVIVTAEKRAKDLQNTSISIQAISGEQLQKEGKKRIDDIMDGVVGVQAQGSQVGTTFYMRGVSGVAVPLGAGTNEPAVAVLVDGVYQSRSETVRGGTLDVSQVEVMRGTQSTTLGASSLAGAVSLVSNQPVFEYQGSGSLTVGNFHTLGTEAVLNVPLTDNQALRIAYGSTKANGYLSSGAGESDLTNARVKYRWQATDNLNMVLTASHQIIGGNGVSDMTLLYSGHWVAYNAADDAAGKYGGAPYATTNCANASGTGRLVMGCPPIYARVPDGINYYDRKDPWDDGYPADAWPNNPYRHSIIDDFNFDLDWDLGFATLSVTPSYEKASFNSVEAPRGTNYRSQFLKQYSRQIDTRLASSPDSPFEWLVGVYYYNTSQPNQTRTTAFPGNQVTTPTSVTYCNPAQTNYCYAWSKVEEATTTTKSVYANASYPILDTLRAIGGVRYSNDKKTLQSWSSVRGDINGPTTPFTTLSGGEFTWSDTTYRVGAEYDLRPKSMAYVAYATGYQPGVLSGTPPAGASKAQELEQWTLGIKNRFFDDRLQVNIEGFNSTYHNRALQGSVNWLETNGTPVTTCTVPTGAPYCYTATAFSLGTAASGLTVPDLTSRGADLDVNYLPTSNDRIDFALEYLSSVQSAPTTNTFPNGVQASDLQNAAYGTPLSAGQAAYVADRVNAGFAAYDGTTMMNSPKWTANFTYAHTFGLPGGSSLVPKVNAVYKSRYYSASGANTIASRPLSDQPAFKMYNAYLSWQSNDGKFSVNGYVKNIENKAILTNYNATGIAYVTLGAPRTFGVTFSANL
ncbi:MAG: TonB-dependent receptor [Steroidobacteraceae bacterium]